jgi:Zn-dependent protease with chaperone function
MIDSYFPRLICLCLAAFFLVHVATGLVIVGCTGWLCRLAARMQARAAARFLLAMRWLPASIALFVVAAVCIPSYLWLEPEETAERLGAICFLAASLAAALWVLSGVRGIRLMRRTRRLLEQEGIEWRRFLAVVGVLRQRMLVSPIIRRALTAEQLEVALRHERAHCDSRDNLCRLALAFSPGLLPGLHGFSKLERHWSRYAEYAADDAAVQGDPNRAIALASALVTVARLGAQKAPLASSLLDSDDLENRVERLLAPAESPVQGQPLAVTAAAALTAIASVAALALRPATLHSAHEALEHLIR